MRGKCLPYKPEQWPEVILEAYGILNDNNWTPLSTIIIGLPDEQESDVLRTLELVEGDAATRPRSTSRASSHALRIQPSASAVRWSWRSRPWHTVHRVLGLGQSLPYITPGTQAITASH